MLISKLPWKCYQTPITLQYGTLTCILCLLQWPFLKRTLSSNYRCFLESLLRKEGSPLFEKQKEAATNAPPSSRLLLFTVATHARGDQVSNITESEEHNLLFHSASPPYGEAADAPDLQTPRLSISCRMEEAGSRDFSRSSVVRGDHSWGTGRETERGVGGREMLWENAEGQLRVYWSAIALGELGADHQHCPAITRGPAQPGSGKMSSNELTVNHLENLKKKEKKSGQYSAKALGRCVKKNAVQ